MVYKMGNGGPDPIRLIRLATIGAPILVVRTACSAASFHCRITVSLGSMPVSPVC